MSLAAARFGRALRNVQHSVRQAFGLQTPTPVRTEDRVLWDFGCDGVANRWATGSDRSDGGLSYCTFKFHGPTEESDNKGFGIFAGQTSLMKTGKMQRSGFAAIRCPENEPHLDLDGYEGLSMRVWTDGRIYTVNVRTTSPSPTEMYQGLMYTPPGKWVTMQLPFSAFRLTDCGNSNYLHKNMEPRLIETVGVTLSDEEEGPFLFKIQSIRAIPKIIATRTSLPPENEEAARIEEEEMEKEWVRLGEQKRQVKYPFE